jgi:hypothetical protein
LRAFFNVVTESRRPHAVVRRCGCGVANFDDRLRLSANNTCGQQSQSDEGTFHEVSLVKKMKNKRQ